MGRYVNVENFIQDYEVMLTWEMLFALNRSAVDAEEVIRCKECKNWAPFKEGDKVADCLLVSECDGFHDHLTAEDAFCAYAERRVKDA